MNTCSTCKYWLEPEGRHTRVTDPEDPDTGKPMQFPFAVKQCRQPGLVFAERPLREDGCAVVDGSDYWAAFFTASEFGCVRHKPTAA